MTKEEPPPPLFLCLFRAHSFTLHFARTLPQKMRLNTGWVAKQFASGAALGPVLDNFHSVYSVLEYDRYSVAALIETSLWTPPLFGVAAVTIGGLALALDKTSPREEDVLPAIFVFIMIYWLSGILSPHLEPAPLGVVLWSLAASSTLYFDRSTATLFTAFATALAGPALELFLTSDGLAPFGFGNLYHYCHPDFFSVCSWIPAVYFAGAAPVAMLGRYFYRDDPFILKAE